MQWDVLNHRRNWGNVYLESIIRQRIIGRQSGGIHGQLVITGWNIIDLVITASLGNNGTGALSIVENQVHVGDALRIKLPLALKTLIIEDVSHQTRKIHDAKIHHRNSLPDEVNLRLVLSSH